MCVCWSSTTSSTCCSLREERQMAHQHVTALVMAREHVYQVLDSCQKASEENQHEVLNS